MSNPFAHLKPAPSWLIDRPIAHRALHDKSTGLIENSFSAFEAAIGAGYGIECDLQITSSKDSVVFHDPVLPRLTGKQGNVRDRSPAELEKLILTDGKDPIFLLAKHLELVAGQVPLILELKGVEGHDEGFVQGVAKALSGYDGRVAVMSFDHWVCAQFKQYMPDIPRGLTAEGTDETYEIHTKAMVDFDLQFVSYNVNELPNRFIRDIREADLPVITWTVRNDEQMDTTYKFADQMTFEGFLPPIDLNRKTYG